VDFSEECAKLRAGNFMTASISINC